MTVLTIRRQQAGHRTLKEKGRRMALKPSAFMRRRMVATSSVLLSEPAHRPSTMVFPVYT